MRCFEINSKAVPAKTPLSSNNSIQENDISTKALAYKLRNYDVNTIIKPNNVFCYIGHVLLLVTTCLFEICLKWVLFHLKAVGIIIWIRFEAR